VITLFNLAAVIREHPDSPVKKFATPPYLVPGTMKAHELFFRLKTEPIHLAVVLDEYGGLDGVVTREDVMEEIFGELYDERETRPVEPIHQDPDGSWIIQGDADFYDISDVLGLNLEHDSRTHTVGGYLLEKLERIPQKGTVISLDEGTYTILEIHRQRIVSVRFHPAQSEED
jgi:CBS domain containing-hemolysin-like protein